MLAAAAFRFSGGIPEKRARAAMAAAKELAARVGRGPIDQEMIRDTASRIAQTRASAEGKEGLTAFLEKRNPSWVKG